MKNRKLNRAKFINYNSAGNYFLTICTKNRKLLFGKIIDNVMILNELGEIVKINLNILSSIYDFVFVKNTVIMPNHIHLVLELSVDFPDPKINSNFVGTNLKFVPTVNNKYNKLSKIIAQFKQTVTKEIRRLDQFQKEIIWQRSFHDHLIRNEEEYFKIYNYISENPKNWQKDSLFSNK